MFGRLLSKPTVHTPEQVPSTASRPTRTPHVSISETDDAYDLRIAMPGVSADNVQVNLADGVLTVRGSANEQAPSGARLVHREFVAGDFYRQFQVSDDIDGSAITATCKHGVLTLALPKVKAVRPRTIPVISN